MDLERKPFQSTYDNLILKIKDFCQISGYTGDGIRNKKF